MGLHNPSRTTTAGTTTLDMPPSGTSVPAPPPESTPPSPADVSVPLFVDLDGTLIKTNLLAESLFALLAQSPGRALRLPVWWAHGRAYLRHRLAGCARLDVSLLPYHHHFLAFLKAEAARGRAIYLATSADARLAGPIAEHVGVFQGVLASDDHGSLDGEHKRAAVLATAAGRVFDFAGNSAADAPSWRHARQLLLVEPSRGTRRVAGRTARVGHVFQERPRGLAPYLRAARPHQWLKNLLVLVPLLTVGAWQDGGAVGAALLAVAAFSLCAAGVYLFNDAIDLGVDRRHPVKRQRPLAAGDLSLAAAARLTAALWLTGLGLGALIGGVFLGWLALYLALAVAYTLAIKRRVLADVLLIAGLYTLRVVAGAAAIVVPLSSWLAVFSVFIFLSVALAKRCAELPVSGVADGRGYCTDDLPQLRAMGVAAGYLAVLLLALFVQSPDVAARHARPGLLWLLCPLVLYWVSRLWLLVGRDRVEKDPMVSMLRDPASRAVAVLGVAVWVAAA